MSTINTGSINVNFPIPGVNNSSQGFRDNFAAIKNNLDTAGTEITDLQNKAIVKSALNGVPLNNDMANTLLSNALTLGFRQTIYNLGNNLTGVVTIDCTNGDVQIGSVTGNISLDFTKWSVSGTQSQVELVLSVANAGINITLPASVNLGKGTLENIVGNTINTVPSAGTNSILHLMFITRDCGLNIEVVPISRPRKATQLITTVPASSVGVQGDKAGLISTDATYLYVCTGTYDGVSNIWKRVTLVGGAW